jgi:hypothetical protein
MRQFRLLVASAALVVTVAVPASALLTCMADANANAMAQMACCKGAKPDCPQASTTLQCCKSADHPQQRNVVKAPSGVDLTLMRSVALPFTRAALAASVASLAGRHAVFLFAETPSLPHLVFSALLI